ncbi:MAG: NAD(P)-binding protein, partial [Acutalibacteraceae bacterium]|nr:NAD(P)-binding protein [Acutalibacteraceae bacterium]
MGKTTGFLDYDRKTDPAVAPLERLKDFHEFHPPLQVEEREEQAARCMNCGIPFCQSAVAFGKGPAVSGCPLHNLIPEWNDELYNGHFESAKDRLLKTASFPEFTGRVCPALCEVACTCGLNGDPVTVRENELFLIERAYASGQMTPKTPAVRTDKKVAVIGSGPSGLAAADMLNKRGHQVTVYEREDRVGGLLMYGIPNMKLEKQIIARRQALMEAEGVVFRTGYDVGADVSAKELLEEYDAV